MPGMEIQTAAGEDVAHRHPGLAPQRGGRAAQQQPAPDKVVDFNALSRQFSQENQRIGSLFGLDNQEQLEQRGHHSNSNTAEQALMWGILPSLVLTCVGNIARHMGSKKLFARLALGFGGLGLAVSLGIFAYDLYQRYSSRADTEYSEAGKLMEKAAPSRLEHRLDTQDERLKNKWPKNMQVATTQVQDWPDVHDWKLYEALNKKLDQHSTFKEAWKALQKSGHRGYQPHLQGEGVFEQPLVSTNQVTGWDQRKSLPRKALLIFGNPVKWNEQAEKRLWEHNRQEMTKILKERFGLKSDQIEVLTEPSHEDIKQALKRMHQFSQTHPGAEAFVMLNAHGGYKEVEPGLPESEGIRQGGRVGVVRLQEGLNLSETQMKAWSNTYLNDFDASMLLVNACFSGSWVAKLLQSPSNQQPHAT